MTVDIQFFLSAILLFACWLLIGGCSVVLSHLMKYQKFPNIEALFWGSVFGVFTPIIIILNILFDDKI